VNDLDGGTSPSLRNEDVSTVAGGFDLGFVDFVSFDLVPIQLLKGTSNVVTYV
jgi:hypothetical protein